MLFHIWLSVNVIIRACAWHWLCSRTRMNHQMRMSAAWVMAVIALFAGGCSGINKFLQPVAVSPRDTYIGGLEKSNLATTAMVRSWLEAGNIAGKDSVFITMPFQETGFFAASEPQARFYRFDAKEGQVLTLTLVTKTRAAARVFSDVFMQEDNQWKELAHADSLQLTYEFGKSGPCLVRLQPELLVNMYYAVTMRVTPVLMNPVKGASNKSIGSFYGDPRDGGKRKHEGVDIFAPRGTPVVAPTDGVVTRVGTGNLGGKVIWMKDLKRGHSYYFAHLDSQMVKPGAAVKQGDLLGTVGNTGNARNTPSHLHFGVYQTASKDPIAYIRTMERLVDERMPDTLFQSLAFRISRKAGALLAGPSAKLGIRQSLPRDTYVRVIAHSQDWFRVTTADGKEGFVEKKYLSGTEKGSNILLAANTWLLTEPDTSAVPIRTLQGGAQMLASFKNFRYIKTGDGLLGWVAAENITR